MVPDRAGSRNVVFASKHGGLRLLGGAPALDFANSSDTVRGKQVDFLGDYQDLIGWSEAAALVNAEEARSLLATAESSSGRAADLVVETLKLRQATRSELAALTGRGRPLLDEVPGLLEQILGKVRLERRGSFLVARTMDPLQLPLVRIGLAIVELLTSARAADIRVCEGPECGWYFLDETRASPRRWCSMRSCGNRAKVARHRRAVGQTAAT